MTEGPLGMTEEAHGMTEEAPGMTERLAAQSSKIPANLWLVTTMCSLISGMVSMSSSRRSRMVLSPIRSSGLGKFSVSGYSLVAYPAAITIVFIVYLLGRNDNLNKSCSVVGAAEVHEEGVAVLGELGEILLGDLAADGLLLQRVHERDASALEAGAGEAAAVDAVGREHRLVDGDELGAAALVVVDGGFTRSLDEGAEPLQVAVLPGGDTFTHPLVLGEEMLRPPDEAGRHIIAVPLEHRLRHVPEECLVLRLQGDVLVGLDNPRGRLAFGHA